MKKLRWNNIIKATFGLVLIVVAIVSIVIGCTKDEAEASAIGVVSFDDIPLDLEVIDCVYEECEKYDIPVSVVFAIIEKESNYKADAVGDYGQSFGLMQVLKKYHIDRMKELNCSDLLNPVQNIKVGVHYLAELIERYDGNIEKALMSYNAGPSRAYTDYFRKGIYSNDYSKAVLKIAEKLEKELTPMTYRTDDPEKDFDRYDAEQTAKMDKLPRCSYCLEHIQDDYLYEINDEVVCESCLNDNFRKSVEYYVE